MARRKKSRSRRSRKLNLNLIDTGAFLLMGTALVDGSNFLKTGYTAVPEIQAGRFGFALKDIAGNLKNRNIQSYLLKVGLGSVLLKGTAKALRVNKIAGLGPINLKV